MQLSDEVAEEVMREAARAKLERCLATALQNVKTRTKKSDYTPAIQVLRLCCPCLEAEVFVSFGWRFALITIILILQHVWRICLPCSSQHTVERSLRP